MGMLILLPLLFLLAACPALPERIDHELAQLRTQLDSAVAQGVLPAAEAEKFYTEAQRGATELQAVSDQVTALLAAYDARRH